MIECWKKKFMLFFFFYNVKIIEKVLHVHNSQIMQFSPFFKPLVGVFTNLNFSVFPNQLLFEKKREHFNKWRLKSP